MKKISIIIVTYNSERDIYDCIESIKRFCDIPEKDLELIIVDNNSNHTDIMFKKITKLYGDDIILIQNTKNGGYGQGNNIGIRKASAPIILIMNPDVRMITPFIKEPLKAFEKDKELCMYGMKQMYSHTKESHSSFCCTYMMNGYLRTFIEAIFNRLEWYLPQYMYFSGSCFFINKEKFEKVGLFDESIFMYGEEDDIHYRITHKFGRHFKYNKNIKYIHLCADRKADLPYEMTMAKVAIIQNEKKGYPRRKTIKNLIGMCNCRLFREWIKVHLYGKSTEWYDMLTEYHRELVKMKNQTN